MRALCGTRPRLGQIDEYRFAVTQFGGNALPVLGFHRAGVDDAEGVSEVAVRVGENAQHGHVDGHGPMLLRPALGAGAPA